MIKFAKIGTSPYFLDQIVGLIPEFLLESDPRSAAEQIDERYSYGGGWCPIKRFKLLPDKSLKYPGNPAMRPFAKAKLRDEMIYVYESGWVAIVASDGTFEVSRLD